MFILFLIGKTENLEVQLRQRGATSRTTRTLNTLVCRFTAVFVRLIITSTKEVVLVGWLVAWFRWDVFQQLHSFLSMLGLGRGRAVLY